MIAACGAKEQKAQTPKNTSDVMDAEKQEKIVAGTSQEDAGMLTLGEKVEGTVKKFFGMV